MRTDRYNGGKPYHIPTLQLETQTCTHTHILIITHAYAMQVGNIEKYGSSTLVVGRVLVTHVQDKYLEKRSDGAKAVRNQVRDARSAYVFKIESSGPLGLAAGSFVIIPMFDHSTPPSGKHTHGCVHTQDMATVARLGGLEYGTIGNRWTLQKDANWNEKHW
uniref:Uncharacterized protein n=1 Tax=Lotharella globosa TaxID=91324 RepID=A0A7S3YFE1_9EUKA